MDRIILWCNNNTGFLSAVLSSLTLLTSVIAIAVSLRTARLPYRKQLLLSFSTNILFEKRHNEVISSVVGLSVSAANIGNRNINLSYLGFAIKPRFQKIKHIVNVNRNMKNTGLICPTDVKTVEYTADELIECFQSLKPSTVLFVKATDTEGKQYQKRCGKVGAIYKSLC